MVKYFYNFKVGTKILIGYIIALVLMALVIIVALLRINQINETVADLAENLATDQHLADQVVTSVWATHFYALQYMDQQNPADLEKYRTEYAHFDQLLTLSEPSISNQERLQYLDQIKTGVRTYGDDFYLVSKLLETREKELLVALDKQGRLAEIKLEQIRANSFFSNDTDTSYQAGNAQRALLLMRVAAYQYLESADPYWIEEFNRWHTNFQASFSKLGDGIQSPIYGTMAQDAQTAVDIYAQSFNAIQDNYIQQQEIVNNRLNFVGPMIREAGAAISDDVAADFQTAAATTQAQASQTQGLLLFTMGLAIITALGSGYFISRSITNPLGQVTDIARQVANLDLRQLTSEMGAIAQGDLTRHLTITTRALSIQSDDEIGQLSRAFNAIIRQVRKAGSTFSEMAANLRILTERNARLVEEAQTARQNAEAASQAKSNFLASMSHELRTPLNAILGYTQILRRDQNLPSKTSEGLGVIDESGRHLLTLINDILDLAKIETGKLWLQPKPVHLTAFLDGVVGMMQLRTREKGLQFIDERGPNLPTGVEVDEKRLRQVIINLLSNAINFTSSGTIAFRTQVVKNHIEPSISNGNPRPAQQLRFIISDTGIGIKKENYSLIFQPFEQLSVDFSSVDGTGLGLPISQQLIQAMGSEIHLESKEGDGSTFWFDLNLPVIDIRPSLSTPTSLLINGYAGNRQKILIVDDKPHNLSILQKFLEPLGFETAAAGSGNEAVLLNEQFNPDLIILDIFMPDMSGAETVHKIKENQDQRSPFIIATSASLNQKLIDEQMYDGFLPKPIEIESLLNMLGNILNITWTYQSLQLPENELDETGLESIQITPSLERDLNNLYDLAMKGNMPGIYERALELETQNPDYHSFAQKLQAMAKAYDEEQVLTFLKQYMDLSILQESQ